MMQLISETGCRLSSWYYIFVARFDTTHIRVTILCVLAGGRRRGVIAELTTPIRINIFFFFTVWVVLFSAAVPSQRK